MIRVARAIYEKARAHLRVNGSISKDFDVTEGVLQGNKLSPTLFILYIADLIDYLTGKRFQGLSIGQRHLTDFIFANDAVIFVSSLIDAKRNIGSTRRVLWRKQTHSPHWENADYGLSCNWQNQEEGKERFPLQRPTNQNHNLL